MADSIAASTSQKRADSAVALWLFVVCALVALMVMVGGATRLTDSGLSITEWKPVTGAVPPLSETHWLEEFENYKRIPEYELVNQGMSLSEFKEIYWWEWGHRFLGRVIGAVFLFPLIFFTATGKIGRTLGLKLFGVFLLGGAQGALGWYMVQSGLSERIDVSQYRLAAHLGLALLLYGLMFWIALGLTEAKKLEVPSSLRFGAQALVMGVFLQMILGAFVAGLRAGRTFNTWPLMDGRFFPDGYFYGTADFSDLFETMAAVQFNHRIGAYLLAAGAGWFYLAARKTNLERRACMFMVAIIIQIVIGIWTVVSGTPLLLGLVHQAGALFVLSTALIAAHGCIGSRSIISSSSPSSGTSSRGSGLGPRET